MRRTHEVTQYDSISRQLICRGDWDIVNIPFLKTTLQQIAWPTTGEINILGNEITKMDSSGAWLLIELQIKLERKGLKVNFKNFADKHQVLLSLLKKYLKKEKDLPKITPLSSLESVGKNAIDQLIELHAYLIFIGKLTIESLRIAFNPARIRLGAIAGTLYRNGYQALPIIALLSFMIGVVITYQMGLQLRNYGANVYIVDLLGLAVLREFGPLLTAIMVAGRTGSSFTAELGIMKINQEIDALNIMGVTPGEILLLPRIIGLFIALPLLTIWSDIFGVIGGMIMSSSMLNITWYDFMHRFPQVIKLKTLLIGLGKTPIFALIIASIGCFQGVQVENNAYSLGRNTTRSVVLAIFFIIVADALFSVIFSKLKL